MTEREKITILTIGTSGDVFPFIALGNALRLAGFGVCIATHAEFEERVRHYGLDFSNVVGNIHEAFKSDKVKETLDSGGKRQELMDSLKDDLHPLYEQGFLDLKRACEAAEIVISSALTLHAASFLTDHFNKTLIFCSVSPAGPTSEFHHVLASPPVVPKVAQGTYNSFTHKIYTEIVWNYVRKDLESTWNKHLPPKKFPKLDPLKGIFERKLPLILYAYSPAILPKPKDWSILQYVTGYWWIPIGKDERLDPSLAEFIDRGSPPIYAGFGSMNNPKDEVLATIVIPAIKALGERMVLLDDGSDLSAFDGDPDIFIIPSANLHLLFPKMKAVVHHGGVGTTGTGIEAGTPTLLVTYIHDQRFWGWRLQQIGAMPEPIPRKSLTYELFLERLTELLHNIEYHKKTLELSRQMKLETGVDTAVRKIIEYLDYRKANFDKNE